jgi:hypothetical protein
VSISKVTRSSTWHSARGSNNSYFCL